MSEFLDFTSSQPPGRKTKIFAVTSRMNGAPLGEVKWFAAWRKYAFFPAQGTVFDDGCLYEIAAHCDRETYDHKYHQVKP
jgi:hypothetical protein